MIQVAPTSLQIQPKLFLSCQMSHKCFLPLIHPMHFLDMEEARLGTFFMYLVIHDGEPMPFGATSLRICTIFSWKALLLIVLFGAAATVVRHNGEMRFFPSIPFDRHTQNERDVTDIT